MVLVRRCYVRTHSLRDQELPGPRTDQGL